METMTHFTALSWAQRVNASTRPCEGYSYYSSSIGRSSRFDTPMHRSGQTRSIVRVFFLAGSFGSKHNFEGRERLGRQAQNMSLAFCCHLEVVSSRLGVLVFFLVHCVWLLKYHPNKSRVASYRNWYGLIQGNTIFAATHTEGFSHRSCSLF